MTKSSRFATVSVLILLLFVVLISGCGGGANNIQADIPTSDRSQDTYSSNLPKLPIESRDFLVGTAGLFAPHFPNSTESDYLRFLDELPKTGELVGVYVDWTAPDVIESIQFVDQFAEGVDPLVALGFNFEVVHDTYFSENLPDMKRTVTNVLETFDLEYLAFGVEVNRLIPEISEAAFLDFVYAYQEIHDLVKEISPDTKVFTIYQLEYLKGAAYLSGREFDPQWDTLDYFAGKLDLLGLTIYPFLEYQSVSDIPDDYYDDVPNHIQLPIAITEMAWLSEDVLVVNGSEEDQVEFLLQLLEKTQAWNLEMTLYSFLYEPEGIDLFESAALITNDGKSKEIYSYWLTLVALDKAP
jgi:hypothetical protein